MRQIKVVLWDIDGTLLNFEVAETRAIRQGFADFNLGVCTDQMLEEYSRINRKYWRRLERGELTKPEVLEGRFREFFTNHGLNPAIVADFNAAYQLNLGSTVCFNPHALEVVRTLQGRVKQYAVTNGTRAAQSRKLARSGLAQILNGVFISEDIGAEKPSPEFFDAVWHTIGPYAKDEVLIVGDSLTSDMQGGNNAGIRCCWYHGPNTQNTSGLRLDYEIQDLRQVLAICQIEQEI